MTKCASVFKREEKLERHITTVHAESSPKFVCSVCYETFNRKDNLKRHVDLIHNKSTK